MLVCERSEDDSNEIKGRWTEMKLKTWAKSCYERLQELVNKNQKHFYTQNSNLNFSSETFKHMHVWTKIDKVLKFMVELTASFSKLATRGWTWNEEHQWKNVCSMTTKRPYGTKKFLWNWIVLRLASEWREGHYGKNVYPIHLSFSLRLANSSSVFLSLFLVS